MMHAKCFAAAAMLLALAGTAMGQAVNGVLKAEYGPIQWTNTTPTGFGDSLNDFGGGCVCVPVGDGIQVALNNNNNAGVTGGFGPTDPVAAAAVTTGFEFAIPLSAIGNPTGAIRIAGLVTCGSYDCSSNQYIGGLGGTPQGTSPNSYPDTRSVDLTTVPGNQFVTVNPGASAPAPALDGSLDASFYGSPLFVQDTQTNYGDANGAPANLFTSAGGGSEIAAVYGRISNGVLYVFVAGNLESNFNKLALFVDTGAAGGQQRITGDNCSDASVFNAGNFGPVPGDANRPGLRFDNGFAANYFLTATVGGSPTTMYYDFVKLRSAPTDSGWGRSLNSAGRTITDGNPFSAIAFPGCPALPTATDFAEGSELNGLYGMVCGNFLHVLITGNLQNNGNRLDLFFDVGTTNVGTVDAPVPSVGQNRLLNTNARVDFNGLNRYGADPADPVTNPGLRFSSGFNADYWVSFRNQPSQGVVMDAWAARIATNGAIVDDSGNLLEFASFTGGPKTYPTPLSFDGTTCIRNSTTPSATCTPIPRTSDNCAPNGAGTTLNPGPTPIYGIDVQGNVVDPNNPLNTCVIAEPFSSFAPRLISRNVFDPLGRLPGNTNLTVPGLLQLNINNANRGGVTGNGVASPSAALAKTVTTGVELKIRLDELGWDGSSPIRITGFVTSGDHGFVSNQVIGGQLPAAQGNLGETRQIDFQAPALAAGGPFYVTINPGTCATAPMAACCTGTTCSVMSAAQCTAIQGNFNAGSATCAPSTCGGAPANIVCCRGTTCTLVLASQCTVTAGTGLVAQPISTGTTCNATGNNTTPCCLADMDKSGGTTVDDIFIFLNNWFTASPFAKFAGDGVQAGGAIDDIFIYLNAWFAGC